MQDVDIKKSFQKLINEMFAVYRGVRLEVFPGGYMLWNQFCSSLEDVDKKINARMLNLTKSVNKLKTN
jgi:hypothetical protein